LTLSIYVLVALIYIVFVTFNLRNTIVPCNPVAQSASTRRARLHERGRNAERQRSRAAVRDLTDNWREDIAFEHEVRSED